MNVHVQTQLFEQVRGFRYESLKKVLIRFELLTLKALTKIYSPTWAAGSKYLNSIFWYLELLDLNVWFSNFWSDTSFEFLNANSIGLELLVLQVWSQISDAVRVFNFVRIKYLIRTEYLNTHISLIRFELWTLKVWIQIFDQSRAFKFEWII